MKRYLLDTCALIWYIDNNKRIKPIAEDIEYYQGDFAVSIESLKEFVYLMHSGKLKFEIDFKKLVSALEKGNISILPFHEHELKCLFKLPFFKEHPDPTDRQIIATAIATKRTLISGDSRFPLYNKAGLSYKEI